ncbi:MAG: response regulator [Leuconostoc mesenteroides]
MPNKNCEHKNCIYILVADDDKACTDLIRFVAKSRGWCVDTARNVREMVDLVNKNCKNGELCYDAIIADLHYFSDTETNLPRMTGVMGARAIREVYKDIPIIFVTGFSTYLVQEEADKVSNETMQKPFDADVLLDRVKHYIDIYGYNNDNDLRHSPEHHKHIQQANKKVILNKEVVSVIDEVRADKLQQQNGLLKVSQFVKNQ